MTNASDPLPIWRSFRVETIGMRTAGDRYENQQSETIGIELLTDGLELYRATDNQWNYYSLGPSVVHHSNKRDAVRLNKSVSMLQYGDQEDREMESNWLTGCTKDTLTPNIPNNVTRITNPDELPRHAGVIDDCLSLRTSNANHKHKSAADDQCMNEPRQIDSEHTKQNATRMESELNMRLKRLETRSFDENPLD
ncbi:hypothetical protein HA402_015491 [Bradysia odoriphaga]|nr:hypothetical protein HA402_015491 [Bradysia odoriphaga]